MSDDAELLRDFAQNHSEAAFRDLVSRHVDLVYAAAVRRCGGDTHRAADVTQEVFIRLARQASKLSTHPALAAWLHTATRNVAVNAMISDERRRHRENEAQAAAQQNASDVAWERLRPELDDAIDGLAEPDRTAVVLRYLQARSFAEIGAALKVTEDAARMRTERALDKLREGLAKRGITSTAVAFATIASKAAIPAPPGLAAQIAHASVAVSSTAVTSLIMNPLKLAGLAAVAGAAFVAGVYVNRARIPDVPVPEQHVAPDTRALTELRNDNDQLKAQLEQLRGENAKLQSDAADARRRLAVALQPPAPGASLPAAQQQRMILNNLRQLSAARDQYVLEHGQPPSSLSDLVGLDKQKYIGFLNAINGEDYSAVSLGQAQPLTVVTKDGLAVTYDPTGDQTTRVPDNSPDPAQLAQKLNVNVDSFTRAWTAYRAAHQNTLPKSPEALIPYFATAKEGADFAEALEARKRKPN